MAGWGSLSEGESLLYHGWWDREQGLQRRVCQAFPIVFSTYMILAYEPFQLGGDGGSVDQGLAKLRTKALQPPAGWLGLSPFVLRDLSCPSSWAQTSLFFLTRHLLWMCLGLGFPKHSASQRTRERSSCLLLPCLRFCPRLPSSSTTLSRPCVTDAAGPSSFSSNCPSPSGFTHSENKLELLTTWVERPRRGRVSHPSATLEMLF